MNPTTAPDAPPDAPLDTAFVLPEDVAMVPVADLASSTRAQFEHAPGDVAIMRPRLRRPCRLVSSDVAALLSAFRTPSRIVDAVLRFSRADGRDPAEVLDRAFESLQALVNAKVLVVAGSPDAQRIEPTYTAGQLVAGFEIVRPIQVLEDSELYQARQSDGCVVALKLLRPGAGSDKDEGIEREAAILRYLDGVCSPRLVACGSMHGHPYVAAQWCDGQKVAVRAGALRARPNADRRLALHRLGRDIVRAYQRLHDARVIHADVHGGNCLVETDGTVIVVDFGLSRLLAPGSAFRDAQRSSVAWFYEPEAAHSFLTTGVPAAATFAGEQYALATLLYHLHTGVYPVASEADQTSVLAQIAEGRLLPFSARGAEPWPDLEMVLEVAMRRDPAGRFSGLDAFLDALDRVPVGRARPAPSPTLPPLVDDVIERVALQGPLFESGLGQGPTGSITYGDAGIAWFLYRTAQIRSQPKLLALGDAWACRDGTADGSAFYDAGLGVTPETVGSVTPYYTGSGVHAVRALLCHAGNDVAGQIDSTDAFLDASAPPTSRMDLFTGRAGQMVAAALLLDTMEAQPGGPADPQAATRDRLVAFLRDGMDAIDQVVASRRRLQDVAKCDQAGIAHGWAGLLFASLRAGLSASLDLPPWVARFLDQLAALHLNAGQGVAWPTFVEPLAVPTLATDLAAGWCRGTAGQVHLWILAHHAFGDASFLDLATRAGQHAWAHADSGPDLCCGLAGRGFAMLALYQRTGERIWLERSRQLAARAAGAPNHTYLRPMSLYRGLVGVAMLLAELERPERAAMPFFAAEGWPRRVGGAR